MSSVLIGEWVLRSLWQGSAVAAVLAVLLAVLRRPEHRHGASVAALLVLALWPLFGAEAGAGPGSGIAGPEQWLGRAWMFGAGFALLRVGAGHLRVRRLRRRSVAAPPGLLQRFEVLATEIAPRAQLRLSADAVVPLAMGIVRPLVLFPPALLLRLDADQVDALLAHELAHLQRFDPLIAVVQGLVEAAYFFHPAAWWISAQIRRESEHCADRVAAGRCGDPVRYARALTALAESRRSLPVPAADGGPLMDRIRTLLDPTPRRRPLPAVLLLLMFGLASAAWAGGDAEAEVPAVPEAAVAAEVPRSGRLEARRQALEDGRIELEDARADVLKQRDALRGEGRSLEARRAQLEAKAASLKSQAAQLEVRQAALADAEERIAEARVAMEATGAERWSAVKPTPKPRRARMSARPPTAPVPPGFAVPPLDLSVPLPPLPPMPSMDASFSMVSTTVDGEQVLVQHHLVGDRAEVLRKLKAVVAELETE